MDVGALVQGIAQIGTNMINAGGQALMHQQNVKNLQYQNKANALNMAMQKMQWDREDNSIQRRVADLKAAGLSPVLAAGQGAQSSTAMRWEPQRSDFHWQNMQAPDLAGMIGNLLLTKSQIEKNTAETARIKQSTLLDLANNPSKISNLNARTASVIQDAYYKELENLIFKETGINRSSSELGKSYKDFTSSLRALFKKYGRTPQGGW